jgi:hypothetical protein
MSRAKKILCKKVLIPAVLLAIIFSAVVIFFADALWDPRNAVRIRSADIEDSTLAIGTHLIHLSALSDNLYEIAQESAAESGQLRIYYKSELMGGTWCDITDATTLSAITEGMSGEQFPVQNSVIDALFFTHHTRSNGITYDLRTGSPVNIFDIVNPYELEKMEELRPLKMQFDLIVQSQLDSEIGQRKAARLVRFWQTNVRNNMTDNSDRSLAALQRYYQIIASDSDSETLDAIQSVMDTVDATRRAQVFIILEAMLMAYIEELYSLADIPERKILDSNGNVIETIPPIIADPHDTSLQAAANESLSNVQASLLLQQGRMLSEGVSVASAAYYQFALSLIRHAEANNHMSCDEDVRNLVNLANILNDKISDRDNEALLLRDPLIVRASDRYTSFLRIGENAEYRAAVSARSAGAVLNSIARESEGVLNGFRFELEFFIDALSKRMIPSDALDFINERLSLTTGWYNIVPQDAFKTHADRSIEEHIEFLSRLANNIKNQLGGSELDELIAQKAALQSDYMGALDNNNLALAKQIEEQIALIDAEIDKLESELDSTIAELQKELADLRDEAADNHTFNNQINGLQGELDYMRGIKDLYDELNGLHINADGSDTDAMNRIGELENLLNDFGISEDDVVNRINELENQIGNLLSSDPVTNKIRELETQLSLLNNSLPENSAGNTVAELRRDMLDIIANDGDMSQLMDGIDALESLLDMNHGIVFPVLKEVYDAMLRKSEREGSSLYDDAIERVEDLILENRGAYEAAMSGNLRTSDLEDLIQAYRDSSAGTGLGAGTGFGAGTGLGTGAFGFDDDLNVIVEIVALLSLAEQTGNTNAAGMARGRATNAHNLGNPYVFIRVSDRSNIYLPVTAVSRFTGMGYVWNRNLNQAVLTRGADYYAFTAYSDKVIRSRDGTDTEDMPLTSMFLTVVHIPDVYTLSTFGCFGIYIPETDFGVLLSADMQNAADELLEIFMRGYF